MFKTIYFCLLFAATSVMAQQKPTVFVTSIDSSYTASFKASISALPTSQQSIVAQSIVNIPDQQAQEAIGILMQSCSNEINITTNPNNANFIFHLSFLNVNLTDKNGNILMASTAKLYKNRIKDLCKYFKKVQ
jgi:hypothetical protein